MFVPRSCQVTRRSRHLFCIAFPTVVFASLPLPERPRNALTSTLTLSGSFFEHLNGGGLGTDSLFLVIGARCFSVLFPNPRGKLCFFLFHRFLSYTAASHPAFFVISAIPSLYSLNSAICDFHLQQEKGLGCTPFHFELCFLCVSLQLCRPLVLKASAVCVSVPDLAMYPAHRCKNNIVFVCSGPCRTFPRPSLFPMSFSPPFCRYCAFPFPQSCCDSDIFLLSMTSVFFAMSLSGAAQQVTTTGSAILISLLLPFLFQKGSSG